MYNEIGLNETDINSEPPTEEPARQNYYIKESRKWVGAFEAENGGSPTASVVTFGCQMNSRDSDKIAGILEEMGFVLTEGEEADFVIYNTCTVRENANQKVYGHLGQRKSYTEGGHKQIIALCGCMMQESSAVEKIKKSYPFVDLIFGTHNIFRFAELFYIMTKGLKNKKHRITTELWDGTDQIVEELPEKLKYSFKAGINIMYGCNNFCSYCIVPYVRGRERSRLPKDICLEAKKLAKSGVVEIMLLGQNVNSYGKTLENPVSFAELLTEIEKVEGIKRIRFMTPHPKDLSDELIEVMKNSKKICRQIHLPLQSGSSRILEKMNRHYTKEDYLLLVDKIKTALPDVALSTDIIVGFPGEEEEDFLDTLDVVRKADFDSAFTFQYSKRTGTPAASMEGQVSPEVVGERFERLLSLVREISDEHTKRNIGKQAEVLVEEVNTHKEGYVTGRLSNNRLVHFKADASLVGELVNVTLTESCSFYYLGRLS